MGIFKGVPRLQSSQNLLQLKVKHEGGRLNEKRLVVLFNGSSSYYRYCNSLLAQSRVLLPLIMKGNYSMYFWMGSLCLQLAVPMLN